MWSKHAYNKYPMSEGRHLEKSKNRHISATAWTIGRKCLAKWRASSAMQPFWPLAIIIIIIIITIKPHHMHNVGVAYSDRCSTVCVSVC